MTPGVYAHFTTTEGHFTARLFGAEVPATVASFVGLAEGTMEWTDPRSGRRVKTPYYDGTILHRVIDDFYELTSSRARRLGERSRRRPLTHTITVLPS